MPRVLSQLPRNRVVRWQGGSANRRELLTVTSYNHKPEWPTQRVQNPYTLLWYVCDANMNWPLNSNGTDSRVDVPNATWAYRLTNTAWDSRLYAGAYAKFLDAARDGSAEVGMNVLEYRQSLAMLVKYSQMAADSVLGVKKAFRRGWEWILRNPDSNLGAVKRARESLTKRLSRADEKRAKRLQREISILDEVSSAFLAYRYGVAPLMQDIAAVCDILSKDYNGDVVYRRTSRTFWGGLANASEQRERCDGSESVSLTGRARVTNPNLLLANRLGVINPQSWAWEVIPFSFVIDWWLPVGTFLKNFTAQVGLTVVQSMISRTRDASVVIEKKTPSGAWRTGSYRLKRRERVGGPLPQPFSVPYGTGLGIQRAQNALALIVQAFVPKLRRDLK